ncbi:hypothetical protein JNJ66_03005 [Candidatus Saccharibacteria bacterium]|nr:hypothetical protein [Candidatus Saccharibacteria bacterium]
MTTVSTILGPLSPGVPVTYCDKNNGVGGCPIAELLADGRVRLRTTESDELAIIIGQRRLEAILTRRRLFGIWADPDGTPQEQLLHVRKCTDAQCGEDTFFIDSDDCALPLHISLSDLEELQNVYEKANPAIPV